MQRGKNYPECLQNELQRQKWQQDRSRRCQYIQSIDTLFKESTYLLLQNIVKFVMYGSELVEIDTLLAQFERNSNIHLLTAILSLFRKRGEP